VSRPAGLGAARSLNITSTVLKITLLYIYMHCDCRLKSSISLLPDWSYGTLHALKSVANHWVNLCCGTLCCRLYASHKNTKCKTCTWQNTKKSWTVLTMTCIPFHLTALLDSKKLFKRRSRLDISKYVFGNRVTDTTLNNFKPHIHKVLEPETE